MSGYEQIDQQAGPRNGRRVVAALALCLAATAAVSSANGRGAPASALETIGQATLTTSGAPVVHAYVDAL